MFYKNSNQNIDKNKDIINSGSFRTFKKYYYNNKYKKEDKIFKCIHQKLITLQISKINIKKKFFKNI